MDLDPASSLLSHAPLTAFAGGLVTVLGFAAFAALTAGTRLRPLSSGHRSRLRTASVAALVATASALAVLLSALAPHLSGATAAALLTCCAAALVALSRWVSVRLPARNAVTRLLVSDSDGEDLHAQRADPELVSWITDEAPTLATQQSDMLFALAEFGQTTAREIMVSRVDLAALPATATLDEALTAIRATGHSRFPIYVEHLDNILGLVHAKDLLSAAASPDRPFGLTEFLRPALFVPESKPLDALLRQLRARRTHLAIVIDEYGGTAGLLTMEDLLEEIVGDMQDERDDEEALLLRRSADAFEVDARHNLEDLVEELDLELATDHFDFDTLGGLIYDRLGAVPEPGATCDYGPLRMTVETVHNHRIGRVLVEIVPPESTDEEG